jgi:micrococcal nuclease
VVNSPSFFVRFDHSPIATGAPVVRFEIDYGDGQRYTNATEAGVFEHSYARAGTFTATAVVTNANGQQGRSSCSFSWMPREAPDTRPTSSAPRADCHPSYPGVCIPPPPDLDCPDVPYRNFTVLPPDPHGFDGNDNDGVGCETW